MNRFPVTCVHQIEITSRCNLKCKYCVHPSMPRPKMDMTWETYVAAIGWAKTFLERGSQGELNLAGIGESTMHPQFIEMLRYARQTLGKRQPLNVTTNGILVNDALAEAMLEATQPNPVRVYVSLHRPERAKAAIDAFRKRGMLAGCSTDPALAAVDWAGQIKWEVTAEKGRSCPWVRAGWVMIMADGRLTRCSFDGSGVGVLGTVLDEVPEIQTSAYILCRSCDQNPGVSLEEVA